LSLTGGEPESAESAPAQLATPLPQTQATALGALLEKVDCEQDVVANKRTGRVVDGHLLVDLAIELGETSIPVKYVSLTPAEEA